MRLDKFTLRGQEAIQGAIELAERNQNQQVEPEHILCAMLDQAEGIVRPLLGKLGANVQVVKNDCEAAVARLPRVQGGQQYLSPRLNQIFAAAQNGVPGAPAIQSGRLLIRFEVPRSAAGGINLYGARMGAYPVDPTVFLDF